MVTEVAECERASKPLSRVEDRGSLYGSTVVSSSRMIRGPESARLVWTTGTRERCDGTRGRRVKGVAGVGGRWRMEEVMRGLRESPVKVRVQAQG